MSSIRSDIWNKKETRNLHQYSLYKLVLLSKKMKWRNILPCDHNIWIELTLRNTKRKMNFGHLRKRWKIEVGRGIFPMIMMILKCSHTTAPFCYILSIVWFVFKAVDTLDSVSFVICTRYFCWSTDMCVSTLNFSLILQTGKRTGPS